MASKNITTIIIALYLVFLGFTSAQPTLPAAKPPCPVDFNNFRFCLNVFNNVLNREDRADIFNQEDQAQCCTLLTKLGSPVAVVCSCELAQLEVPDLEDLENSSIIDVRFGKGNLRDAGLENATRSTFINVAANQFVNLCPGVTSPPNFRCD